MMKRLLQLLSILTACSALAGTIALEPGTPVFREAEMPGEIIAVATEPTNLESTGNPRLFLIKSHPLARYFRMTEVRLPDGRTGYVHPAALLHPDGQLEIAVIRQAERPGFFRRIGAYFSLASLFLFGVKVKKRDILFLRGEHISIRTDETVVWDLDGEEGMRGSIAVETLPQRMRLFVPKNKKI